MNARTIAGISAELMQLAEALTILDPAAGASSTQGAQNANVATLPPGVRASLAGELCRERRLRDALFGGALFGEPAWDILLDLYARQAYGKMTSISDACIGAAAPGTTALRHVTRMLADGLLTREMDSTDGRRSWVHLSAQTCELIDTYLDRLAAARTARSSHA